MSLYGALFTGVTGLNAQTQSMAMISDNIANVNTVGYKRTTARFATLVTDSGSLTTYSPAGVRASPFRTIGHQGQISTTNSDTDVAITGNGFIVVRTEPSGVNAATLYTRAGSFSPDSTGNLRNAGGYYLQGWPLDANGAIPAAAADLTSLQTVNITQFSGTASATTSLEVGVNLDAGQAAFAGAYAVNDMADGTVQPHFFRNFLIFDALGGSHELTAAYLKTGTNTWAVEVYAANPSEVTAGATALRQRRVHGRHVRRHHRRAREHAQHRLDQRCAAERDQPRLGHQRPQRRLDPVHLELQRRVHQPERRLGGSVERGQHRRPRAGDRLVQLPLSTFADPSSLEALEGNSYAETNRSGNFNLREAGTGGAGLFAPSALEASNVDIAGEFTDMIITQRAYSANTRVITTADEMLEELIRLRR
jgi:flagellar hook protein FlgE